MCVEIFKTNINTKIEAIQIAQQLRQLLPGLKVNFDLDDCDKILRTEGQEIRPDKIIKILEEHGYYCSILK